MLGNAVTGRPGFACKIQETDELNVIGQILRKPYTGFQIHIVSREFKDKAYNITLIQPKSRQCHLYWSTLSFENWT